MPQRAYADSGAELRDILARTNIMAVYERVTGLSSNGPRAGRNIMVHCPTRSHDDTHQSCSLDPQKNAFHSFCCDVPGTNGKNGGGILALIVFGGKASSLGEAARWLKESGLVGCDFDYRNSPPLEVVHDRGGHGARMPRDAKLARQHDYTDLDGKLRYRAERFEWPNPEFDSSKAMSKRFSKSFVQQHATVGVGPHCAACTITLRSDIDSVRAGERSWQRICEKYGLSGPVPGRAEIPKLWVPGHAEERGARESLHSCAERVCRTCTESLQKQIDRGFRTWRGLEWKYKLTKTQLADLKSGVETQAPSHPGELRWGSEGVERIPYNLRKLVAAAQAGETVYYVEGEKKVDDLAQMGLVGTTNMGGSRVPIPDEWMQYFRGAAQVVYVPDCDGPGREASLVRLRAFQRAGIPAVIFDLDPSRADKYDVSDWYSELKKKQPSLLPAEARAQFLSLRDRALQEQTLEKVLVVDAPKLSPKDPTRHAFVHASAPEALRLLRFVPFSAAYLGANLGSETGKVVEAIIANGAPVVKFGKLARSARLRYEERLRPTPLRQSMKIAL